jgi:hypothetical protein
MELAAGWKNLQSCVMQNGVLSQVILLKKAFYISSHRIACVIMKIFSAVQYFWSQAHKDKVQSQDDVGSSCRDL